MSGIASPFSTLTPEERAYQIWAVHPRDLDRLGYTNEAAQDADVKIPQKPSGQRRLGARELFFLDHIKAAIEQAANTVNSEEASDK